MAQKQEEKLQTLDELFNYNAKVTKACSLGIVIDATRSYHDENRGHYIKRLKIIDSSFNMTKSTNGLKFGYCTVTIFAKRPEELPDIRALGDIIYLRRFAFEKYNDNFQSHSHRKDFCYWILLDGSSEVTGFSNYQSSRINLNMEQDKFSSLLSPLQQLRNFGRKYLQNNSIAKVITSGTAPKDEDWIIKLISKGSHGKLRVQHNDAQFVLQDCPTSMQIGEYGKLRSVAWVQDQDGEHKINKNSFTSLIKIHEWMFDAQNAINNRGRMIDEADQGIYTDLNQLLTKPIGQIANKTFWVRVEVFSISAATFSAALKYYDSKKNQVFDTPHKGTSPVYKLSMYCQDSSTDKKYPEIWIFSYDGKCGNFVSNVNLNELNEYSSYAQEQLLYHKRYDQLLEAQNVVMMVQCLSDNKSGRLFRALEIKA